jgi:hypothetical protein
VVATGFVFINLRRNKYYDKRLPNKKYIFMVLLHISVALKMTAPRHLTLDNSIQLLWRVARENTINNQNEETQNLNTSSGLYSAKNSET